MTLPPDDIPVLRFSADEVPERDRLPMSCEVHGRLTARLDLEPAPGGAPHFEVAARVLPGLIVSSFALVDHGGADARNAG
jgi:hypothetical protein